MWSKDFCLRVEDYVKGEGFTFPKVEDTTVLCLGEKVCHTWKRVPRSCMVLALAAYASLVEPPLLYN